jgi:hypothetical protein
MHVRYALLQNLTVHAPMPHQRHEIYAGTLELFTLLSS